jgi:hypothetical protein
MNLGTKLANFTNLDKVKDCDCLPVCADLSYKIQVSQINWEWDKWLQARRNLPRVDNRFDQLFFPTSRMKMILSSLNLMRKIGVCITSEENGESKLTSEENLFNNLLH